MRDITDHAEIGNLLARYCHALDRRDWDALATCFVTDAVTEYAGTGPYEGYAAFEAMARDRLSACEQTQHLLGSIEVALAGDVATTRSHAQAMHLTRTGDRLLTGVTYDDDLVRTEAGWRIARRTMRRLWGEGLAEKGTG